MINMTKRSSMEAVRVGKVKVFINGQPYDVRYIVRSNVYIWCSLCRVYVTKDFFVEHYRKKHKSEAWFY